MIIARTEGATSKLGRPSATVEYGTVNEHYSRRWSWPCGCSGELIGSELIELFCCRLHAAPTARGAETA